METARFQVVGGVRTAAGLEPRWPVVGPGEGADDAAAAPDGTAPQPVAVGGHWYGWRLLSRNHRDLARSPVVYPTEAACMAAVERVRPTLTDAVTQLFRNPRTGRWTWTLETPDGVVATGSRGYLRRRECHDCVAQVIALAPVALAPEPGDALETRQRSRS